MPTDHLDKEFVLREDLRLWAFMLSLVIMKLIYPTKYNLGKRINEKDRVKYETIINTNFHKLPSQFTHKKTTFIARSHVVTIFGYVLSLILII